MHGHTRVCPFPLLVCRTLTPNSPDGHVHILVSTDWPQGMAVWAFLLENAVQREKHRAGRLLLYWAQRSCSVVFCSMETQGFVLIWSIVGLPSVVVIGSWCVAHICAHTCIWRNFLFLRSNQEMDDWTHSGCISEFIITCFCKLWLVRDSSSPHYWQEWEVGYNLSPRW